jgi:hypothetical protein
MFDKRNTMKCILFTSISKLGGTLAAHQGANNPTYPQPNGAIVPHGTAKLSQVSNMGRE